jgi:hypothetical protein
VLSSATARHLIRILRQRVEKAEEAWRQGQPLLKQQEEATNTGLLTNPGHEQTENYAARASIRPAGDGGSIPNGASTL